jgi:hypothetical protein
MARYRAGCRPICLSVAKSFDVNREKLLQYLEESSPESVLSPCFLHCLVISGDPGWAMFEHPRSVKQRKNSVNSSVRFDIHEVRIDVLDICPDVVNYPSSPILLIDHNLLRFLEDDLGGDFGGVRRIL